MLTGLTTSMYPCTRPLTSLYSFLVNTIELNGLSWPPRHAIPGSEAVKDACLPAMSLLECPVRSRDRLDPQLEVARL